MKKILLGKILFYFEDLAEYRVFAQANIDLLLVIALRINMFQAFSYK
jgi:hypothetical protein